MDVDISQDGKHILFGEEGENSGLMYEVGLRPTDGSPARHAWYRDCAVPFARW